MSKSENEIKEIQNMNVFKEDWTTGQLKFMTDDQIIKCHHVLYKQFLKDIRTLRGQTNIMDVSARSIVVALLEETENRIKKQ